MRCCGTAVPAVCGTAVSGTAVCGTAVCGTAVCGACGVAVSFHNSPFPSDKAHNIRVAN